MTFICHFKCNY